MARFVFSEYRSSKWGGVCQNAEDFIYFSRTLPREIHLGLLNCVHKGEGECTARIAIHDSVYGTGKAV